MRKYVAEFIGTYALVFCGTGAIVIDQVTNGAIGHIGVAITFGLIVTSMIYTFGNVSGAHLNPAVSIAFTVAKQFPLKQLLPYVAAQAAGALAASLMLRFLFEHLGSTLPAGTDLQSFVLEFILTYFLMLVIIHVSQGAKEIGTLAGIAIGSTILLEAIFAGPICGASMNPVRSLAPAIISGNTESLWIYLTAPILGSVAATLTWKAMNPLSFSKS